MGIYVALHLKRIIMSVATSHDQGASPDHSEQKRIKGLEKLITPEASEEPLTAHDEDPHPPLSRFAQPSIDG